jgi:hypothetical protein
MIEQFQAGVGFHDLLFQGVCALGFKDIPRLVGFDLHGRLGAITSFDFKTSLGPLLCKVIKS